MDERRDAIRERAHALWERAGCPQGRSEEFWYAARREIEGDESIDALPLDPFEPPIDEPPEVAFEHGVPVGMPGERIVEQGVEDDRLADRLPGRGMSPEG
ncbi:DUF2934 family protein [Roseiarcus fermentans]|uniref:DUF2934 family protein n=1 Tax=Roseiarcus fermentans TaxID=1473586 RepID=A0A366FTS8_9HYPH|nr:DUF2934 family protein [Roseiarcus fermentans]